VVIFLSITAHHLPGEIHLNLTRLSLQLSFWNQIKKRQQDVVRFLEANRIEFEEVDITMSEEKRQWMYKNIPEDRQPAQGNPLPPQIFSDDRYCGVSSCYGCQWMIYWYTLLAI
uniref:SH3 domain binding glutamate rich protein like 2 n=1 Tax=Athene cunicularia TaxID=194338 RepID=A0A663NDJ7_ATHCN